MRAKVNANGVRLYESNSTLSAAKGFLAYGEEIEISAEYGDWCQLADGRWVEACYTEAIEVGGGGGASSWNDLEDRPTNVSAFTNDAGYQTASQVNAIVNSALGVIENGSY